MHDGEFVNSSFAISPVFIWYTYPQLLIQKQLPVLGQYSIGRVGQNSIGANSWIYGSFLKEKLRDIAKNRANIVKRKLVRLIPDPFEAVMKNFAAHVFTVFRHVQTITKFVKHKVHLLMRKRQMMRIKPG